MLIATLVNFVGMTETNGFRRNGYWQLDFVGVNRKQLDFVALRDVDFVGVRDADRFLGFDKHRQVDFVGVNMNT